MCALGEYHGTGIWRRLAVTSPGGLFIIRTTTGDDLYHNARQVFRSLPLQRVRQEAIYNHGKIHTAMWSKLILNGLDLGGAARPSMYEPMVQCSGYTYWWGNPIFGNHIGFQHGRYFQVTRVSITGHAAIFMGAKSLCMGTNSAV